MKNAPLISNLNLTKHREKEARLIHRLVIQKVN